MFFVFVLGATPPTCESQPACKFQKQITNIEILHQQVVYNSSLTIERGTWKVRLATESVFLFYFRSQCQFGSCRHKTMLQATPTRRRQESSAVFRDLLGLGWRDVDETMRLQKLPDGQRQCAPTRGRRSIGRRPFFDNRSRHFDSSTSRRLEKWLHADEEACWERFYALLGLKPSVP